MNGKNILIGVTGGIAVYKMVEVISRLRKKGANIKVIMTKAATEFVTPLTFREISGNPVYTTMWDEPKTWNVEHIALAKWADVMLIAPATANIIGKIANGIADDMLTTVVMATTAKVMLAPAMNSNMFLNKTVQNNITMLDNAGYQIISPGYGRMACGDEGLGRLPEPETLVSVLSTYFCNKLTLKGKKIMVTAGGTREPIDPVRFIGNRSSGKMGYALARYAAEHGADVLLITGPTSIAKPCDITVKEVETAAEMREAVLADFDNADIVIKAAAVADYRPSEYADQKIKKSEEALTLVLTKNPDILKELGEKKQQQVLVGFAAETNDLITYAQKKMREKNLDMIVANDVTVPGAGFNADNNLVKIILKDGTVESVPMLSKDQVAEIIFDRICEFMLKKG